VDGHGRELSAGNRQTLRVVAQSDDHGVNHDAPAAVEGEGVRINEPRLALENEFDPRLGEATALILQGAQLVNRRAHASDGRLPLHLNDPDRDSILVGEAHFAHQPGRFRQHARRRRSRRGHDFRPLGPTLPSSPLSSQVPSLAAGCVDHG
jgi:hypothetical protein